MRVTRPAFWAAVLVLACGGAVSGQTTTPTTPPATTTSTPTAEGLTLSQTLGTLAATAGSRAAGSAIGLAMAVEVGTTPLITASPSFTYKVDPSTGLRVRQATTFGPSFTERALTSGEGRVAVYASVTAAAYSQIGDQSLERMQFTNATGPTAASSRRGLASLVLQAETLLLSSSVGVTDKLDLSVGVPLVRTTVDGIAWMEDGGGNVLALAKGAGTSTGLGDLAVSGKYRLASFGEGIPDPGGVALVATVRLPTGDKENFRGLGITRTMVSAVVSTGTKRFRPHGNVGFDFWSDSYDAITDEAGRTSVSARHQIQYAAGFEFEAAPKVTLLVDLLGRHILGAGQIGLKTETPAPTSPFGRIGATSVESLVAIDEGVSKLTLAPGLRVNLKGNFVLSLNALTTLRDNGLHDKFIPVVGLDWTF